MNPTDFDAELEKILWEYKMDIERFSHGAQILQDKASKQTAQALKALFVADVLKIMLKQYEQTLNDGESLSSFNVELRQQFLERYQND